MKKTPSLKNDFKEIKTDELEIIMDISKKINHNIAKHWDEQLSAL